MPRDRVREIAFQQPSTALEKNHRSRSFSLILPLSKRDIYLFQIAGVKSMKVPCARAVELESSLVLQ